jgi:cell division protein FtsZ
MINIVETLKTKSTIKVVGVGGAGCKTLNSMMAAEIEGVEYVAINTDSQALASCDVREKIQIGADLTAGLGAGGDVDKGKRAAEEDMELIQEIFGETRILFLTSGFGGGTGTGATPVIARAAQEAGLLVVALITKPFEFEGNLKMQVAEDGIRRLKESIDSVMTIPNQRLFEIAEEDITMVDAFRQTDAILCKSVQAISRLILKPGMINLDFAHIQSVMSIKGSAMLGFGEGEGEGKAAMAMEEALACPLVEEREVRGARGVLISLVCGADLMLTELNQAVEIVRKISDPEANIIFGANVEPEMEGRAAVTVMATGLTPSSSKKSSSVNRMRQSSRKDKNDSAADLFSPDRGKVVSESPLVQGEKNLYRGEDLDKPAIWRKKRKEKSLAMEE